MGRLGTIRERLRLQVTPQRPASADRLRRLADADIRAALDDPAARRDCDAFVARFVRLGFSGLPAGANLGDRRALFHLVHHFRPRRVLEIGTCNGSSTAFMAGALAAVDADGEAGPTRLVTVDITDVNDPPTGYWKRAGLPWSPREILAQLGLDPLVRFESEGSDALLREIEETFDFVFIDGDHSAPGVYRDAAGVLRHLSDGAIVMLHDYYPQGRPIWDGEPALPGTSAAADRLQREIQGLAIRPVVRVPWPTKKGTDLTSLAVMTRQAEGDGGSFD